MTMEKLKNNEKQADFKITIYQSGIIATIFMLVLIPVQIFFFIIWPHPTTIVEWFNLFNDNWLIGLISFDFLYLLSMIAILFLYLALFFALYEKNKALTILALTIG